MKRRIIEISKERCNGCGLCVKACHEGAIGLENNKAVLLREDYCDGLGDCLPTCPMDAITFVEREAMPYDEEAVLSAKREKESKRSFTCPGQQLKSFKREGSILDKAERPSMLNQWPCQLKLMPIKAPYYAGAELLLAADCTAYAYGDFHKDFMQGKITIIACPKLDNIDYSEKLGAILKENEIKSITLLRMEVPCCGGLQIALDKAMRESGRELTSTTVTISTDGRIL